jgi:hypothetical protein
VLGPEREIHGLSRGELLIVVDLDVYLVAADPDTAFQEASEIHCVDHLTLEQVGVA